VTGAVTEQLETTVTTMSNIAAIHVTTTQSSRRYCRRLYSC